MSYHEVAFYQAKCDRCGTIEDDYCGEYAAMGEPDGVDDSLDGSDWYVQDGNHLCPGCVPAYDYEDAEADGELAPEHGHPLHECYDMPTKAAA